MYLKAAQEKPVLNKHRQINDIGILRFSESWKYCFSYNAGNIQESGWWVLPATYLCMSTDNAFFAWIQTIHFSLCSIPTYPSPSPYISFTDYTTLLFFVSSILSIRLDLVPWGEGIFSMWIQLLSEVYEELSG